MRLRSTHPAQPYIAMTRTENFPDRVEARPHGNRAHRRRKLAPMAYVELGQDNGGILLNLSEGGFAVQSALALTSREFSELRFQVPALQGWLAASGRIVWISDSKKEAGIQFTELPGEARREIHNWVSAEGAPEKSKERIPVAATPWERPKSHEPAVANYAPASTPEPAGPRTASESTAVAVAEPPQEFHFTDYSMFAAEPERDGVWAQPGRTPRKWRTAVVGTLAAALFFALGATVGRGTVDRWIGYLGDWTASQLAAVPGPKVTPPTPPAQLGGKEGQTEAKADDDGDSHRESPSSEAVRSEQKNDVEPGADRAQGVKRSLPKAGGGGSASTQASAAGSAMKGPRDKRSADGAMSSARGDVVSEPSRLGTEHSILVNAPEPGSRPFYVDLPGEAVSASAGIAISARRTLEILPRSWAASPSERVIVGKLISHSEPFYPVEARNRRLEGNVELRARVGRTGQIIGVTPISGPGLLSSAAMMAVREWRYEPTYINGDPAETLADITVVFRLP